MSTPHKRQTDASAKEKAEGDRHTLPRGVRKSDNTSESQEGRAEDARERGQAPDRRTGDDTND